MKTGKGPLQRNRYNFKGFFLLASSLLSFTFFFFSFGATAGFPYIDAHEMRRRRLHESDIPTQKQGKFRFRLAKTRDIAQRKLITSFLQPSTRFPQTPAMQPISLGSNRIIPSHVRSLNVRKFCNRRHVQGAINIVYGVITGNPRLPRHSSRHLLNESSLSFSFASCTSDPNL